MSNSWHPDEEQLLAFADGELDPKHAAVVAEHEHSCDECRRQIAGFRAVYPAIQAATRSSYPPPPQPWADLRPRLTGLDVGRVRSRRLLFPRVSFRWAAAAAAVVLGALVVRLTTEQTVSAAELLEKSTIQEAATPPPKRVRVKTGTANWVRSTGSSGHAEEAELASLFQQANFDWDEPLSSRAFARWRASLAAKDDRVRILDNTEHGSGRFYRITTSTPAGVLAQASITIRAADMRAVHETFQFRNDKYVEMFEALDFEPTIPEPRLAQEPAVTPAAEPRSIGPADELRVVAALHSIGADLGEPVAMETDKANGRIVVTALATRPEKQDQLRAALAGIPFVDLRFEQPETVRTQTLAAPDAAAEAPGSTPLQEELLTRLGSHVALENFTNHVMDLSEAALTRAHALRALGQRFPAEVEAQLAPEDRRRLDAIKADHILKLRTTVGGISDAMKPLGTPAGIAGSVNSGGWQSLTESVLDSAQTFDRLATEILAGSGPAGEPASEPDEAVRNLGSAAAMLQFHVDVLAGTIAESRRR